MYEMFAKSFSQHDAYIRIFQQFIVILIEKNWRWSCVRPSSHCSNWWQQSKGKTDFIFSRNGRLKSCIRENINWYYNFSNKSLQRKSKLSFIVSARYLDITISAKIRFRVFIGSTLKLNFQRKCSYKLIGSDKNWKLQWTKWLNWANSFW